MKALRYTLWVIKNIYRLFVTLPWEYISIHNSSRRLRKWIKKNKKEQDPTLYPFDRRWAYIYKKVKLFNKRLNIKIKVVGLENLPKGSCWITPNHTSNFDGFFLIEALGHKLSLSSVAKISLKDYKLINGFFIGSDSYFLDRKNIRESISILNSSANYAKKNNRGMVLFPEGTRSLTTELSDFKCGSFKFPKKYGLPIVPVTITGTLFSRKIVTWKSRTVTVTIHKPIKQIEYLTISDDILCKKVYEKIKDELDKYEKGLKGKELEKFNELREKARADEDKKNKKLEEEMQF